jgi:hypothetical protein
MLSQFFAGGAAGVAVLLGFHWVDTLKLLGQQGPIDWPSLRRNPGQLYAGIAPALLETACYNGIQFGVYEMLKATWIARRRLDPRALVAEIPNLIMGLLAGCVTQSLTCPMKVVAIRIGSGVTGERSMAEAVRNITREGGLAGFFKGNITGLMSQPLTTAFQFFFFERFRAMLTRLLPAGATQLVTALAGGFATSAATVVAYPPRMAKDRLQGASDGTYTGMFDVWKRAFKEGGVFANGGIYGGCIQDATSQFAKKGATFWCRDLFVAAFLASLRSSGGGRRL